MSSVVERLAANDAVTLRTVGANERGHWCDFDFRVGDRVARMSVETFADDGMTIIVAHYGKAYQQWVVRKDAEPWEIVDDVVSHAFYAARLVA